MNLLSELECAKRILSHDKKLLAAAESHPSSFLAALMKAHELGVSFNSPQEAKLVCDTDASGNPCVRLDLTKRGMMGLAARHGKAR